jgi:glycosyltransferase involved in cell wall biosynthesis
MPVPRQQADGGESQGEPTRTFPGDTPRTRRPGYLLVLPWELDGVGGVTEVVRNVSRELAGMEWTPIVLITSWAYRTPTSGRSGNGSAVWRWRMYEPESDDRPLLSFVAFMATFPRQCIMWRRLARQNHVTVVNVHFPTQAALFFVLSRWCRVWRGRIIVSVHGADLRSAMETRGVTRILWRLLLKSADAVVAPCEELIRDAVDFVPEMRPRTRVIRNGVNHESLLDEADDEFSLPPALTAGRYVLNVATFEHKKAQDVLVDAFARIVKDHPDVRLALVGRAAGTLEDTRARIRDLSISKSVHVFTNVPHRRIPAFLRAASIFCLPSRKEGGNPLAILEAAVFGLPVVACAVGGVAEMITHDVHGLLVPVDDPERLAAALDRMLREPAWAHAMAEALRRRVLSDFRWSDTAAGYADLVQAVSPPAPR